MNGPERPRRDDVRRYCLDCSKATGRLVERTCPALDRKRAASAERSKAKRATEATRKRTAVVEARSVGGIDLQREAERLWNLPAMRLQRRWREDLPSIEWRRSRTKARTSGTCWPATRRIVVTIGTDRAGAVETVAHELVHAVLPNGTGHGRNFYSLLARVCREAWPAADLPVGAVELLPRAWERDQWLATRIRRSLDA